MLMLSFRYTNLLTIPNESHSYCQNIYSKCETFRIKMATVVNACMIHVSAFDLGENLYHTHMPCEFKKYYISNYPANIVPSTKDTTHSNH